MSKTSCSLIAVVVFCSLAPPKLIGPLERPPKIGLFVVAVVVVDGIAVIVIEEGSEKVDVMPAIPPDDPPPPNIIFSFSPPDVEVELLTIEVGVAFGMLKEKAGAGATTGTSSFLAGTVAAAAPVKPPNRLAGGGSTFSIPFVSAIFGALRLPNIPVVVVAELSPNPPKLIDGFGPVVAAVAIGFCMVIRNGGGLATGAITSLTGTCCGFCI